MNICMYGGTFNPIHKGHIGMAVRAYEEFALDKLYFIPSGNSYFKSDVLSSDIRLELTNAAVSDISSDYKDYNFLVSPVEVERSGPSYSYESVNEFLSAFPGDKLYFLVGADTLVQMDTWKNPGHIFRNTCVLVATRSDTDYDSLKKSMALLAEKYDCNIKVFEYNYDISSSSIREMIINNDPKYLDYVTESVAKYIDKHNLYRK